MKQKRKKKHMGNCCGAEADNDNTSIASGGSVNVVERRGQVWKCYACQQGTRTFYSYETSRIHNRDEHPNLLHVCHSCNAPFRRRKDRENHEAGCQV